MDETFTDLRHGTVALSVKEAVRAIGDRGNSKAQRGKAGVLGGTQQTFI